MQVRYIGLFDEVSVPEISTAETVKRGEPVEVDDAVAERLLAQRANWEAVPATKPAKAKEE
ncbi:MAG TPA: hypothetical protein PKA95_08315 [Thermomicrobiales bacterium]|jgi:hypothetical protein|nr:hypothetical protein [Thermomicrobiales bacterium]